MCTFRERKDIPYENVKKGRLILPRISFCHAMASYGTES